MRIEAPARRALLMAAVLVLLAAPAFCSASRVVILKVDGLPGDLIESLLREKDPATGRYPLPWLHRVFVERGAWVRNFYVRGISLSAPSWALLDTGQHMAIHGNAEYDRLSGRVYDYLNFFPFYWNNARARRAEMPGAEVLDRIGVPLLIDRFPPDARYQSFQLFQRGVRWQTLKDILSKRILLRSPRETFTEWQIGFEMTRGYNDQVEREVLAALANQHLRYIDYYFGDFDHVAHLANDRASQFAVLTKLDGVIGRMATAIESSPLADQTLFVLVSDHGINSTPEVYSQGYDLVRFFQSGAGGGHHVLINRYPLGEYKLRALDPFVSEVVLPSSESSYLRDESSEYPTALLDLDGNERASVSLRNSDLNLIHILLEQLDRPELAAALRRQARAELCRVVERHRASWDVSEREIGEELGALRRAIMRLSKVVDEQPKKWSAAERQAGLDQQALRDRSTLDFCVRTEHDYAAYVEALGRLLAIERDPLPAGRIHIGDYLVRRATGDFNSVYDLQHYVAGPRPGGLVGDAAGALDVDRSFLRLNYFSLLSAVRVRNNVQPGVGPHPVDFLAMRISGRLPEPFTERKWEQDPVWLYGDENHQALLLFEQGSIRYLPVRALTQNAEGEVRFEPVPLAAGLPLHLLEDPNLEAADARAQWLSAPHTEAEWFRAIHRTRYSNALLGLKEFFRPVEAGVDLGFPGADVQDARLLRRLAVRQRNLAQADLLVVAADHWNFNVRGFNPGGNHGSFLRISTHSVLMFAGAGVPPGTVEEQPHDSLDLMPTILSLMGANPSGIQVFPGARIRFR